MKGGGKLSRARKPVGMQSKNLTIEEKMQKQMEEETITVGNEQLKRPPNWLIDDIAKKEFKRLVKEFEKIEVVGNLDLNNICGYCNAYSLYRKATEKLKTDELLVEKPLPNGSTQIVENPLIRIQKTYAEEIRKFASMCGLSIDSRLKIATVKVSREQEEIKDDFGDI